MWDGRPYFGHFPLEDPINGFARIACHEGMYVADALEENNGKAPQIEHGMRRRSLQCLRRQVGKSADNRSRKRGRLHLPRLARSIAASIPQ